MAINKQLVKYFSNFGGLDLRNSDITRSDEKATVAKDVDIRDSLALNKRKGYKALTEDAGGFGAFKFANRDVDTGSITNESLVVDSNLKRLKENILTITYTGGNVAEAHLYLHTDNKFYLDLYDNSIKVLNQDLGVGINEASPYTLAQLDTAIDAVSNFSATVSGTTSNPAAFLENTERVVISSSLEIKHYEFESVSGASSPFATSQTNKNDADFENASAAQVNNVLYIASGYDELMKYDGQNCYRAGIDIGEDVTNVVADISGSASVVGNYTNQSVITVTAGHTLRPGDKIWYDDSVFNTQKFVEVNDVTTTIITLNNNISILTGNTLNIRRTGFGQEHRTDIRYKLTYEMIDNKGNIVEGIISENPFTYSNTQLDQARRRYQKVTISNLQDVSKFNTKYGVITTNGNSLNAFTVSAHNFDIGDNICFLDKNRNVVDRKITNIVGNVITFDGTAVDILGLVYPYVSAGLKINVWRNSAIGSDSYYLLTTVPNYSQASTQDIIDRSSDVQIAKNPYLYMRALDANIGNLSGTNATIKIFDSVTSTTHTLTEGVDFTVTAGNALTTLTSIRDAIIAVATYFNTVNLSSTSGVADLVLEATDNQAQREDDTYVLTQPGTNAFAFWGDIVTPAGSSAVTTSWLQGYETSGLIANAQYEVPVKAHGLPPKARYISVFRNQIFLAGDIENPNQVYYADIDGNEYFPPGDNAFDVSTLLGDYITGIAPLRTAFIIFKNESLHAITGDIALDTFRVDSIVNSKVGCVSHHSIQDVMGNLYYLTKKGVYKIDSASMNPVDINDGIEPLLTSATSDFSSYFKRAVAVTWNNPHKYLIFLPNEVITPNRYNTSSGRVFAYDFDRDAWLEWTNMDFSGGVIELENDIYFTERRLGSQSGNVEYYNYKVNETGNAADFADHEKAISMQYKTNWFNGDEPSLFKKFLRIQVHSTETTQDFESDNFTIDVKTENDFNPTTKTSAVLDFDNGSGGRLYNRKTKLRNVKARNMRFVFENSTLNENVLISGFELELAVPFRPGVKE